MPATIRFGSSLKQMLGILPEYSVEPGRSVRETLVAMGIKPELVAMVTVNDEMEDKDFIIREGDVVRLIAVIGGG